MAMEPVEALEAAEKRVQLADHLLGVTYPLLKETRLLLASAQNLSAGVEYAMTALLVHERRFKRVPAFKESFHSKLTVFKMRVVPRYNISAEFVTFITNLRQLIDEHNESPMEFARKEKLVICSPSYRLRTLDDRELKRHVLTGKRFIQQIRTLVHANDGVFD